MTTVPIPESVDPLRGVPIRGRALIGIAFEADTLPNGSRATRRPWTRVLTRHFVSSHTNWSVWQRFVDVRGY